MNEYWVVLTSDWQVSLRRFANTLESAIEFANKNYEWKRVYNTVTGESQENQKEVTR